MAKYNDGASICLQGGAADDGSEHWEAHNADSRIEALGKHPDSAFLPTGTARIDDIRDVSEQQVKEIRKECAPKIAIGVSQEFKNTVPSTLGRTTPDELPSGNAYNVLRFGNTLH